MTTPQVAPPPTRATDETRIASGVLVLTGLAVMAVQTVLFLISGGQLSIPSSEATWTWQMALAMAGVTVELMGLALFEIVLARAGDVVYARIGLIASVLAAVAWIISAVLDWALTAFFYPFEAYFVVASGVSVLAYATAVLRTGALPRWAGWLALAWSGVWLARFPFTHGMFPPYAHQPAILLFGVLLLLPRRRTRNETSNP
jgi:hypothetical protein